MPGPVTIQLQIDPESMNAFDSSKHYEPVHPMYYLEIEELMEEFKLKLEKFGYIRTQMWTELLVDTSGSDCKFTLEHTECDGKCTCFCNTCYSARS